MKAKLILSYNNHLLSDVISDMIDALSFDIGEGVGNRVELVDYYDPYLTIFVDGECQEYRALQRIYKLDSYDGDWNNKARNIVQLVLVSINRRDDIKLVEELISVLNEWLDIYGILLEDGV